jgi:streptogramin lyase
MKSLVTLAAILWSASSFAVDCPTKPASDLKVVTTIPVAGDFMGLGFNSIWMATGGMLHRVDVETNTVSAKIAVGPGGYRGVGIGEGFVWIPAAGNQRLYKVDPQTNTVVADVSIPFSGTEGSIGVGGGSVWIVTNEPGNEQVLTRLAVRDLKIEAKIALPPGGNNGVVYDFGAAWVTNSGRNSTLRVDPATNTIRTEVKTGKSPRFIAAGEGAVWSLNQGDGTVTRIDPATNQATAIEAGVPGGGGDIGAGEGGVYATTFTYPVAKIDAATNQCVVRFQGSGFGDAIRVGYGSIWVSGSRIHRIALP